MPNGKPGDAPWTDFFIHGREVFPADIASMLKAIHVANPTLIEHLHYPDMWDWEKGLRLEEGRKKLRKIIQDNCIPID